MTIVGIKIFLLISYNKCFPADKDTITLFKIFFIVVNVCCEHESEQFTFYRVPKVLFTEEPFKNMNCEAKLLYGLLLDKMGLSRKSGWFDKQGRAFVYYGINRIMEDLGCAHNKAEKLLSELEQAGLLRRKRQGLGKPSALYPLKFENRIS